MDSPLNRSAMRIIHFVVSLTSCCAKTCLWFDTSCHGTVMSFAELRWFLCCGPNQRINRNECLVDRFDDILHHTKYVSLMMGRNCALCVLNLLRPSDAYMRQQTKPSLVQIMACRLVGAKSLSEPTLVYCQLGRFKFLGNLFPGVQ